MNEREQPFIDIPKIIRLPKPQIKRWRRNAPIIFPKDVPFRRAA